MAIADGIKCRAILYKILQRLVESFNVGKTMDDKQIGETIDLILEDEVAKNFKPDDFILCFNMMKKGVFGKSFDRIDVQTIFESIYAYWDLKAGEVEQMAIKRHFELTKDPDPAEVNVEGQKKVLEILKGAIENVQPNQPQEKKIREKTEKEVFVQACFLEFDRLHDKNPVPSKAGRFISYEGKTVDQVEYTELKLKEAGI